MLLRRMSLSHTRVSNWQSLYKVWAAEFSYCVRERQNVCRMLRLCVSIDGLQYSVYQGQSTKPSSVHSAVPWYQWGPLRWPQPHRLPHQSNCTTRSFSVANVKRIQAGFVFSFVLNFKLIGGFWSQYSWEPFHHQSECAPCYRWKYVLAWLPTLLSIHWSVYAPNDAPSSTREEENDGAVRLPNRCCQERTGAAGRSYHLVLCHLHPSGLCFRADLVKSVLLQRTYLCP